jgi:hypothetical protein
LHRSKGLVKAIENEDAEQPVDDSERYSEFLANKGAETKVSINICENIGNENEQDHIETGLTGHGTFF